jgi:hypothetical protein
MGAENGQKPVSMGRRCQSSISLRERSRQGFLLPACHAEKEQLSVIDPAPGGVFAMRLLAQALHFVGIHYSVVDMGSGEGLALCHRVNLSSQVHCELGKADSLKESRMTRSHPGERHLVGGFRRILPSRQLWPSKTLPGSVCLCLEKG